MLTSLMLVLTCIMCSIIQDNANYEVLFLGYIFLAAGWITGGDAE